MANERTYPCLPCRDLDETIGFYEALGFAHTYRQMRPNPYAVVAHEDIQIHLFGMENLDALYHAFAQGLRSAYGKLPTVGIPRILRPRKRYGTVRGFSVVDPGGNWLRVSRSGDTEEEAATDKTTGLAKIVDVAARLGDAHGDEAAALKTLESGLARFVDVPAIDRARALLYRAELAVRLNDHALARSSLSKSQALALTDGERAALADEIAQVSELLQGGE
jgi:catechol 2,3-dioxygenase-like lactoylglutathione lyase family enzyme